MNKLNQLSEINSSTKNELKNSIGLLNVSIEQNANESLLNSTSVDDYFDAHQSMSEPVDCIQTNSDKFIDKNTTKNQQISSGFEKSSCDNNSDDEKQSAICIEHSHSSKSLSSTKKSPMKADAKIENNTGIFYTFANAIKNAIRITNNTTINNSNVNNNCKKLNSITINEGEPAASSTICHKPLVPSSNFIVKDLINSSTSTKCELSSPSLVPVLSPYLSPKLTAPSSPLLAGKSMDLIFSKTGKRRRQRNLIINHLSPVRNTIDDYEDKEISSPLYKQKKVWNIRARDPIARMKNNFSIKSKSLEDENYKQINNKIIVSKIDEDNLKRTWNIRAREPIARMKNFTIKSKSLEHFQQKNNTIVDKTDKSLTSMIETMSLKNKPFQQQKNSQTVDKIKASNFKRVIDPMTSFD